MSGELDLSGSWKGIFNYPRKLPPSQFDAQLRDHLGVLAGETLEIGSGVRDLGQPLHAFIEGHRKGSDVSFVKFYDTETRANYYVQYEGRVDGDGNEIQGTWTIPGVWSGTFLMIRAKPVAALVELKIAEPVR